MDQLEQAIDRVQQKFFTNPPSSEFDRRIMEEVINVAKFVASSPPTPENLQERMAAYEELQYW